MIDTEVLYSITQIVCNDSYKIPIHILQNTVY